MQNILEWDPYQSAPKPPLGSIDDPKSMFGLSKLTKTLYADFLYAPFLIEPGKRWKEAKLVKIFSPLNELNYIGKHCCSMVLSQEQNPKQHAISLIN